MFGLYIHIPFCKSKCAYCDFYSLGRKDYVPDNYIDSIINQIKLFCFNRENIIFDTIYFGGGTPSLLNDSQITNILNNINYKTNAEITIEVNPETVNLEKLKSFYACGINRISVGVQTASDENLKILSRRHNSQKSIECLSNCHKAGFTNISGDIMLSLPNYSFKECLNTIKLLSDNGCVHISSYLLKIEKNTRFYTHPPLGIPDEDLSADFYLYCVDKLKEYNYNQYEISNFAKDNFASKHNLIYWNCENYLGIGPSAHSCVDDERFYYNSNINEFINNPSIIKDGKCTTEDYIMLQLRLNSGLNLNKLKEKYNFVFTKENIDFIRKCEKNKLCTYFNDILTLTPNGMLIQNQILNNLI